MKKTLLIFITFLFTGIISAQDFNIEGQWSGTDYKGEKVTILFDSKGYVTYISNQIIFGGENIEEDGVKFSCKYEIDKDKIPYKLDYVYYEKDTNRELARMGGVYKIIDENKIQTRVGLNGNNYTDFTSDTEDEYTLILERL